MPWARVSAAGPPANVPAQDVTSFTSAMTSQNSPSREAASWQHASELTGKPLTATCAGLTHRTAACQCSAYQKL